MNLHMGFLIHLKWKTAISQLFVFIIFCVMSCLTLQAQEEFSIPAFLSNNVEFWTKIYSQYSIRHVVIHDNNDLSIIYRVVNLDDYFDREVDLQTKWKKVKEIKDEYRKILDRLAALHAPIDLDSLTAEECHVYILWSMHDEPDKFLQARNAIRAQLGLRDRFEQSVIRSGSLHDYIVNTFALYDLPADLAYLPHVESLFNYNSHSKVGAVGLWQFIRHTGRLFMTIDMTIDERRDPIAATRAAAQLLKLNYDELQSWPLAITAYNHGLNGMKAAVAKTGSNDFGEILERYESRTFGFASRNFYAEFLAACQVAKNYKAYFGDIKLNAPMVYQTIALPQKTFLRQIAGEFDLPVDSLIAYNPAWRWAVVHNQQAVPQGYLLRLPYRDGYDPREVFARNTSPAPPQQIVARHTAPAFAYKAAGHDTINAATESDVLQMLKKPLPSFIQHGVSAQNEPVKGGM